MSSKVMGRLAAAGNARASETAVRMSVSGESNAEEAWLNSSLSQNRTYTPIWAAGRCG
jgi:hypothetical protein